MNKFLKYGGILASALIAFTNMCKLVPKTSGIGKFIQSVADCIDQNTILSNVMAVVFTVLGCMLFGNLIGNFFSDCAK